MNTLNELIEMNKMMVAAEPNPVECFIQVQCAWCKTWLPSKPGLSTAGAISHSICLGCELEMRR